MPTANRQIVRDIRRVLQVKDNRGTARKAQSTSYVIEPFRCGAEGGTRTPTVLLPPAPQAGASANSATSACGRSEVGRLQVAPTYGDYFFAGTSGTPAGTGAFVGDGVGDEGCVSGVRPPTTDPGPRLPMMPSVSAPIIKIAAQIHVARESTVAPLRAPNAA